LSNHPEECLPRVTVSLSVEEINVTSVYVGKAGSLALCQHK
jgi:hypothetical protein